MRPKTLGDHLMNTPATSSAAVVLLILAITLGYAAACATYPYKPCRSCHGFGRFRSALLGGIRLCRRCRGTGLTLRFGRQLYNAAARTYRRHHRPKPRKRPGTDD